MNHSKKNGENVEKKATGSEASAVDSTMKQNGGKSTKASEALQALAQSDKARADKIRSDTEALIFETSKALVASKVRLVCALQSAWLQARLAAISAEVLGDTKGAENFNGDAARISNVLAVVECH